MTNIKSIESNLITQEQFSTSFDNLRHAKPSPLFDLIMTCFAVPILSTWGVSKSALELHDQSHSYNSL